MKKEFKNEKKWLIGGSVVAVIFITLLIIGLSFWGSDAAKDEEAKKDALTETQEKSMDSSASSSATVQSPKELGDENEKLAEEITAQQVAGKYTGDSDGWIYEFYYAPQGEFDGTFVSGYSAMPTPDNPNPTQPEILLSGTWKLESGEIKLFGDGVHQNSLWAFDGFVVDSHKCFRGKIDENKDLQQAVLTGYDANEVPTQILNLYDDGKMIVETHTIRTPEAEAQNMPEYVMKAGTYQKNGKKITLTIDEKPQEFYIVADGIAWMYKKG